MKSEAVADDLNDFLSDSEEIYRVERQVSDWVGFTSIWNITPSCPPAQALLPISHQPRQN